MVSENFKLAKMLIRNSNRSINFRFTNTLFKSSNIEAHIKIYDGFTYPQLQTETDPQLICRCLIQEKKSFMEARTKSPC